MKSKIQKIAPIDSTMTSADKKKHNYRAAQQRSVALGGVIQLNQLLAHKNEILILTLKLERLEYCH